MVKGWNELTIKQYKQILRLPKDDDWIWGFLAIAENTTKEDIITRPFSESVELSNQANRFLDKRPSTSTLKWNYKVNGKKYRLSANPNEITTAQYIDFMNADKTVEKGMKIPTNLSGLIAIFLIPEDAKGYNEGYDVDEVAKEFEEHMGIEDALAVCNFFSVLFRYYLRRAVRKARKALKQIKKEGSPELKEEAEKTEKMLMIYKELLNESRRSDGWRL